MRRRSCDRVCTDACESKALGNSEDQELIGQKDTNDDEDGGYHRDDEWRGSVGRTVESTGLGLRLGREELLASQAIHLLDIVANIGGKANPNQDQGNASCGDVAIQ
jgi:hypothetical protein